MEGFGPTIEDINFTPGGPRNPNQLTGGTSQGSDADQYTPPYAGPLSWASGGGGGDKKEEEWDWSEDDDEDTSITTTVIENGKVVKRKKGKKKPFRGSRTPPKEETWGLF